MSNTKHLADLLKVCSILPALAIMPAMADLPNTTGNAWVFGDLNLGALASDSVVGGRYVSVNANKVNDLPKYKMVGRSVNLSGTTDNRPDVYVGPVELTLRELSSDEKFACNWQAADGSENSNWVGTELDDGEKSMTDFDFAKKFGIEWGDSIETIFAKTGWNPSNQEHQELAGVLWSFANRDATKTAGALATNNADLTVDGAKISADSILLTNSTLNIVKQSVPVDFQEEEYRNIDSDGVTTFVADKFTAKDNTRILVGAGAELDLTGVKDALFTNNVITGNNDGGAKIENYGTVKLGGDVRFENATMNNNNSSVEEQKKIVYSGDGNITFVNGRILNRGAEYSNPPAIVGGLVDFRTTGDISFSGDMDPTDSSAYVNTTILSDMVLQANKITVSGGKSDGYGGAIFNAGDLKILGKENLFTDNHQTAVAAEGKYYKLGGGALYNRGAEGTAEMVVGLSDSSSVNKFISNSAVQNGGAIETRTDDPNSHSVLDVIGKTTFSENTAGVNGGAIMNWLDASKENATSVINVIGEVNFDNNIAGKNGGAIYNNGTLDLSDAKSTFVINKANESGGAIYNAGKLTIADSDFVENSALEQGGAIYNEAGATTVLSGNNLFSGNVANKLANDIHNMGTLNITSGTTAFDGGVTGTGTFTLASDATLELGTATINQGKIDLYGTVVASMLNDSVRGGSYGRFIGDVTVGDDASFKLNVGAAGTYNIWNGKIVDAEQVTVGDIYEIAGIDVNGVKIVTKSVADIAETVGISTQAAGAVAGLANANSGKAHQVSLALQNALNAGDVEYIERETKKLNPTEKPVAQAAASSVQNQVLSLTSGRMTGGISVGRAGGDERSQENGFWIQGLFNKSKFADAFHGYTRGVALGADTLIDNKWTIGGGLAFNNTDVHADGAHTDIDTKTMFLYGQYKPNNWFVNATATYSMSEYTENKTVAGVGLGATYDVDAYGAQIMTGYDFTPGITTEAGLRYLHIAQDDYIDGRDAQIMATDTDFLTGIAGLKYAFAIENDWAIQLRPELRAAMTYDFISDDTATTVVMPGVEAYAVNGELLSRMGGEFGIGLTALYKGMEVSLMYDLDLHKDYTSQTGMIKFRGRF